MAIRYDDRERIMSLSARDLADQGFSSPHVELELAMSRRRRLAEARSAHRLVQEEQARLDAEYTSEATVRVALEVLGWTVRVFGRLDGWSREADRPVVEELKTVALDEARLSAVTEADFPAYVAQVRVYQWMLARAGHPGAVGRLLLLSLLDGSRRVLGIEGRFEETADRLARFLGRKVAEREARLRWLAERRSRPVPFPYPELRPGQEEIVAGVASGLATRAAVLVQAPTGLGKTGAVLAAVLQRAFSEGKQVAWLTARGTQQQAALDAAAKIRALGCPLRVVVLVAREKACVNDEVVCRAEVCRFAHLHHDKVQADGLIDRVWEVGTGDRQSLRTFGLDHVVCPYQLGVDAARGADVVIGDYNYVFDPDVSAGGVLGDDPAAWILVVDEAHQLPERARQVGSPVVSLGVIERVVRDHEQRQGYLGFVQIAREVYRAVVAMLVQSGGQAAKVEPDLGFWSRASGQIDAVAVDHALLASRRSAADGADPWVDFARAVLRFRDTLERAGPETVAWVDPDLRALRLICLDPSPLVGTRIARFAGSVLMSATLSPANFYQDLLGLGDHVVKVSVPWPYPAANRPVFVVPRVSTRFVDRERDAEPTAQILAELVEAVPGNVAIYFSSFAMLADIIGRWRLTERRVIQQRPDTSDEERAFVLQALRTGGERVVLAAVLGGVFAEGVDLPGGALQAVFVVGPAFPPVGLERELLQSWYEERYQSGFQYASLVPGLTKVVQAAGRVVRGPEDRGAVVLVDRRFRHREVAALLPAEWAPRVPEDPVSALREFFATGTLAEGVEVRVRSGAQ
jgi:DNA excision repair protein ERCC-2